MSRDYRYLGTIGYFDEVFLPLEPGKNELWFAVGENFGGWGLEARLDGADGVTIAGGARSACVCPRQGRWNAQNLEGKMECKGAFGVSRKLKPVKDNGVIFVMEDDCSRVFGDSMTKKEEDVLMIRDEDCTYRGIIEGEEGGVSMVIDHEQVRFLPGALDYSRQGYLPGGLKNNLRFLSDCVEFEPKVPQEVRNLLFDPQTSGGLLLVVNEKDSAALAEKLIKRGVPAGQIGKVVQKTRPLIQVR